VEILGAPSKEHPAKYLNTARSARGIRGDGRESETRKLPFCITGEIDTTKLHRRPRRKFAEDGRLKAWGSGGRKPIPATPSPVESVPSSVMTYGEVVAGQATLVTEGQEPVCSATPPGGPTAASKSALAPSNGR
jgi:hypothetical protein